MKKKILILLLFFLSISIVFAQEPKKTRETFGEVTCKDDGSITFTREPRYKKFNVERISDNKIFTDIPGNWVKKYVFESDKLLFTQPGNYIIKDNEFGDNSFTCPGVHFHCSLINYSINSCRSDENKTIIEFQTIGTTADQIRLKFWKIDGSLSTFENNFKSKDIENTSIILLNNKTNDYLIEIIKGPAIKNIDISHSSCAGEYYPNANFECNYQKPDDFIIKESTKECEKKETIDEFIYCIFSSDIKYKYVDISDSICNYNSIEPKKCIEINNKLQSCLFLEDQNKIDCAKSALSINNIIVDGLQCNELINIDKVKCFEDLRKRVYELIVFRFAILESKSINMFNQNLISNEYVKEFIIKTENTKLTFYSAKNKQERKDLIKQVRLNWINMLKGLGR